VVKKEYSYNSTKIYILYKTSVIVQGGTVSSRGKKRLGVMLTTHSF